MTGEWWPDIQYATSEQVASAAASTAVLMDDVASSVDHQTDRVVEDTRSASDTAKDEISNAIDRAAGIGDDIRQMAKDYVDTYLTSQADDFYTLSSDIASEAEAEAVSQADDFYTLMGDVAAETESWVDKAAAAVAGAKETVFTWVDDRLEGVTVNIDFGFEWLAARLEDLLEIPARVFFTLVRDFFFEEVE